MTILNEIVKTKRTEVESKKTRTPLAELQARTQDLPPTRDFAGALSVPPRGSVHLIAEVKKASPSAGLIVQNFDPVAIATDYKRCGASALSVLTDETYFQGHLDFIWKIKDAVDLPILRKDFIVDTYQIVESRAAGADAILLITEVLSLDEIAEFHAAAIALNLSVLIEGHQATNLLPVLDRLGPHAQNRYLLGINNRDLRAQKTDITTTVEIAAKLPAGTPFVSESGLHTREHVQTVARVGATAILVGESLLKSGNIQAKVRELIANEEN